MDEDEEIHISLVVDSGADPIGGRYSDAAGTRPFVGWLELAAMIEAARDRGPSPSALEIPISDSEQR